GLGLQGNPAHREGGRSDALCRTQGLSRCHTTGVGGRRKRAFGNGKGKAADHARFLTDTFRGAEVLMRRPLALCVLVLAFGWSLDCWGGGGTSKAEAKRAIIPWPAGLPVYDHVVIVVEENKDYDQIIDNPKAPYINFTLREQGANFTQMFGEEHNSEGNYFCE